MKRKRSPEEESLEDFPLEHPKCSASSPLPGNVDLFSSCEGMTVKLYIKGSSQFQEKDKIQTGFAHLIGEAMHNLASAISQGWPCPIDVGAYCGFLDTKATGPQTSAITFFLRLLPPDDEEMEAVPPRENYLEERYTFHATSCTGKQQTTSGMCEECFLKRTQFARMCKSEVDLKGNPAPNQKSELLRCDVLACAVTL
jgi:hypothetical protein